MNKSISIFFILFAIFATFSAVEAKKCDNCGEYTWSKVEQKGVDPELAWDGSGALSAKDGLFYAYGGLNGSYPVDFPVKSAYVFNPDKTTWKELDTSSPNAPPAMAEAMSMVSPDGKFLYISGGRGPFRRGYNIVYNATYRYDIKKNIWSQINQTLLQQDLANRSTEAIVVGNKAYAFSGSTSTMPSYIRLPGAVKTDTIVFEFGSEGWSKLCINGEEPPPRTHHHLIYNKDLNTISTYGGYCPCGTYISNICNYRGDLWSLDLDTNTWSQHIFNTSLPNPGPRDNMKFIYADKDQLVLIGGSDYNYTNFLDIWRFDLNTSEWTELSVLPLIDPVTGAQTPVPKTLGSYYFQQTTKCSAEFYFSRGTLSEISGSPLSSGMYKLSIPIRSD